MMTSDADPQARTSHTGLLACHPLVFFFVIAYAGAWLVELPVVLSQTGTASCHLPSLGLCWR
ncbi:hypothetical protein ACTXG6_19785 [Pseudonocardia sp. Cha107L01]|jgi:hypothetical protein|uniref:hypothetical protein n=1 Tax=Pseudonocardia sp. Cha107L01 TaxID=3457576 RepID=UPI00403E631A